MHLAEAGCHTRLRVGLKLVLQGEPALKPCNYHHTGLFVAGCYCFVFRGNLFAMLSELLHGVDS